MDRQALLQMCLGMLAAPLDVEAQQPEGRGIASAAKHQLPVIYEAPEYVELGGLMSHGPIFRHVPPGGRVR